MKLSKTNAKKFISILSSTKKKVFTCDNLSKASGLKVDIIKEYISEFYGMIYLDPNYNLINLLPQLNDYVKEEEKITKPVKKVKKVTHKEYEEYSSVPDYIYKKMTLPGGIFDSGYVLNEKDKKILKHLLNKK
jgi:hypothetical protein